MITETVEGGRDSPSGSLARFFGNASRSVRGYGACALAFLPDQEVERFFLRVPLSDFDRMNEVSEPTCCPVLLIDLWFKATNAPNNNNVPTNQRAGVGFQAAEGEGQDKSLIQFLILELN